jgi:hypothetical protein
MKWKKGFELSVNFIVIIIISLVVFVGGIVFTNKFFNLASDYKDTLDKDTEQQIENLLNDGSKVAIAFEKKKVVRGSSAIFGLGINNVKPTQETFEVTMTFSKAYSANNSEITETSKNYINTHWIFASIGTYLAEPHSHVAVPIHVQSQGLINDNAAIIKGTYVFDVCVCTTHNPCSDCSPSEPNLYDGYVHKIYLEVT